MQFCIDTPPLPSLSSVLFCYTPDLHFQMVGERSASWKKPTTVVGRSGELAPKAVNKTGKYDNEYYSTGRLSSILCKLVGGLITSLTGNDGDFCGTCLLTPPTTPPPTKTTSPNT